MTTAQSPSLPPERVQPVACAPSASSSKSSEKTIVPEPASLVLVSLPPVPELLDVAPPVAEPLDDEALVIPAPVPATLVGFVVGAIISYTLNRRHTFATDRSHSEATWRFAVVASSVFCLTYLLMNFFVNSLGAPYLPAQVVTTGMLMFVSFFSHRLWTFARAAQP